MIRILGILTGAAFTLILLYSFTLGAINYIKEPPVKAVEYQFVKHPKKPGFSHEGPFGTFDRGQLQRGLKVYQEVCAACHSMNLVAFRNFEDLGFTEGQVKTLAKTWATETPSINPDTGEASSRPSLPSDQIPSPYLNNVQARAANNNALPPDLSLMTKARHDGTNYVYSLLTGYSEPPADLPEENRPSTGLYYNAYFANLNIAMAPPLVDGQVSYDDGTNNSLDQMAKDVSAFLAWTAEPKMEVRKKTGWAVILFLLFFTTLAYFSYQNIWADLKSEKKKKG